MLAFHPVASVICLELFLLAHFWGWWGVPRRWLPEAAL